MRLSRRTLLAAGGGGAVVVGTGVAWIAGLFDGWGVAGNRIAVLPFTAVGALRDQAYLVGGLTDDVRGALAANVKLQVTGRTSSIAVRGSDVVVGQKLGVDYLLKASAERAGTGMRVAARLVDAQSGGTAWLGSFDSPLAQLSDLYSVFATAVADQMNEQGKAGTDRDPGPNQPAPYEATLRGRALMDHQRDPIAALERFNAALTLDPLYGRAYVGRSQALTLIASNMDEGPSKRRLFAEAIAAGKMATARIPDIAAAHLALGDAILMGTLDPRTARPSFDRAYKLGAGEADTLRAFAAFCAPNGRYFEALNAIERAKTLDPLNAAVFKVAGDVAFFGRRFGDVIAPMQKASVLDPKLPGAHAGIGNALIKLGRFAEARTAYAAEPDAALALAGTAIAEHALGNEAAASAASAALTAQFGDKALYQTAQVRAQSGDVTGAVAALLRARKLNDPALLTARTDPLLDPIRQDRAFIGMLYDLQMT
jgi:TolB-like protein/tetratricopeptide (TPR) repeat protein